MDILERLQMHMQDDWERAASLKDLVIPRAIRWYTGEAVEGAYDDEEDDEDEDDDDEDDDEEEEEEESPKGKKNLFKKPATAGANPEECKQQ